MSAATRPPEGTTTDPLTAATFVLLLVTLTVVGDVAGLARNVTPTADCPLTGLNTPTASFTPSAGATNYTLTAGPPLGGLSLPRIADPASALLDPDRDGVPNLLEFIAATDPQDARSVSSFVVIESVNAAHRTVTLRWHRLAGADASEIFTARYGNVLADLEFSGAAPDSGWCHATECAAVDSARD